MLTSETDEDMDDGGAAGIVEWPDVEPPELLLLFGVTLEPPAL